ncbi:BsaWI family type II restriction enzyme [Sphingomonas quercus]|uniref:BsaWI restriction endonuclease type 2 domain-containing protein n=1 Tax=Sphingomonas quercus TaxID=2842451 RepID=A0ABS6BHP1_9SPHN|nr:BsaWI family type II restriction enzyme [Sphingomonas quercus]MBU3077821.1 hypothetical protein [Sphingomonas quercus]
MATIEVVSAQRGIPSVWVEIDGIDDRQVTEAKRHFDELLESEKQISDAVALAFVNIVNVCPAANPSDLWQHVIYRHACYLGFSDNRWKRISGYALERALVALYKSRLETHGIRMRIVDKDEANRLLEKLGVAGVRSTKVDIFIEGYRDDRWVVFGGAHVKASIAERIVDDVPASLAFMQRGLLSVALTMDSKSYPPPHGNGVNWGEFGARSAGVEKERLKRGYIEVAGNFDGLFSYNLRTPPSPANTQSGKRIWTLSLAQNPDPFVDMLVQRWASHPNAIVP